MLNEEIVALKNDDFQWFSHQFPFTIIQGKLHVAHCCNMHNVCRQYLHTSIPIYSRLSVSKFGHVGNNLITKFRCFSFVYKVLLVNIPCDKVPLEFSCRLKFSKPDLDMKRYNRPLFLLRHRRFPANVYALGAKPRDLSTNQGQICSACALRF